MAIGAARSGADVGDAQTADRADVRRPLRRDRRQHRARHPGQARGHRARRCCASSPRATSCIEDVPGVGKTSLAKALAALDRLHVRPASSSPPTCCRPTSSASPCGTAARASSSSGPGPIFANIVLGDEINRASPEDAVGAARGDGRAPGHRRRHHLPARAAVHGDRHPEPDRARGHLPAAREPARPLPHAGRRSATPTATPSSRSSTPTATDDALDDIGPVATAADVQAHDRRGRAPSTSPRRSRRYLVDLADATRRHPHLALGMSPRATLALQRVARARAAAAGPHLRRPRRHQGAGRAGARPPPRCVTPEAQLQGIAAGDVARRGAARRARPHRPGRGEPGVLTRQGWLVGRRRPSPLLVAGRVLGARRAVRRSAPSRPRCSSARARLVRAARLELEVGRDAAPRPRARRHAQPRRADASATRRAAAPRCCACATRCRAPAGADLLRRPARARRASARGRLPAAHRAARHRSQIGPLEVVVGDPFGLHRRRRSPRRRRRAHRATPTSTTIVAAARTRRATTRIAGAEHPNALGRTGEDFYALRPVRRRRRPAPRPLAVDRPPRRAHGPPGRAAVAGPHHRAARRPHGAHHAGDSLELAVSAAASIVTASRPPAATSSASSPPTAPTPASRAGHAHVEAIMEHLADASSVTDDGALRRVARPRSRARRHGGALVAVVGRRRRTATSTRLARLRSRFGSVTDRAVRPVVVGPGAAAPAAAGRTPACCASRATHRSPTRGTTPCARAGPRAASAGHARADARRRPRRCDRCDRGTADRPAARRRASPPPTLAAASTAVGRSRWRWSPGGGRRLRPAVRRRRVPRARSSLVALAAHGVAVLAPPPRLGVAVSGRRGRSARCVVHRWVVLYADTTTLGLPDAADTSARVSDDLARRRGTLFQDGHRAGAAARPASSLAAVRRASGVAAFVADWAAFRLWVAVRGDRAGRHPVRVLRRCSASHRAPGRCRRALRSPPCSAFLLLHRVARQETSAGLAGRPTRRAAAGVAAARRRGARRASRCSPASSSGPLLPGRRLAGALLDWRGGGAAPAPASTISPLVDIQARLVDQSDVEVFTVQSRPALVLAADRARHVRRRRSGRRAARTPRPTATLARRAPTDVPTTDGRRRRSRSRRSTRSGCPAAFEPRERRAPATDVRYDAGVVDAHRRHDVDRLRRRSPTRCSPALPALRPPSSSTAADRPTSPTTSQRPLPRAARRLQPAASPSSPARSTAGATTPYDKALRPAGLLPHDDFTYDLDVPARPQRRRHRATSCSTTRRGYCEQFAGTFAAMARSLGLPGPGRGRASPPATQDPTTRALYHVRGKHAHAWPEVYLAGHRLGAVRADARAAGAPNAEAYTGVPEQQADRARRHGDRRRRPRPPTTDDAGDRPPTPATPSPDGRPLDADGRRRRPPADAGALVVDVGSAARPRSPAVRRCWCSALALRRRRARRCAIRRRGAGAGGAADARRRPGRALAWQRDRRGARRWLGVAPRRPSETPRPSSPRRRGRAPRVDGAADRGWPRRRPPAADDAARRRRRRRRARRCREPAPSTAERGPPARARRRPRSTARTAPAAGAPTPTVGDAASRSAPPTPAPTSGPTRESSSATRRRVRKRSRMRLAGAAEGVAQAGGPHRLR